MSDLYVKLKTNRGTIRRHGEDAFWTRLRHNIRAARHKRKISQSQLAKAVGYRTIASISFIENGYQNPSLFRACLIAARLGIDLGTLVGHAK